MIYRLAANGVLIAHLAFVLFVVFGALLVLRWPRLMYLHIPAFVWGGIIEFTGMICPLTPLEVQLRQLSGAAGYQGGFIEHYIVALLYPSALTRNVQIVLGFLAVVPNVVIYTWLLVRRKRDLVQRDG
jgi:hypothetical protein